MNDNIREKVKERRNKLMKTVDILDKMLESGDDSLLEKQYWDEVVEDFENPDAIDKNIEDGLTDEEIKFLNDNF